MLHSRICDLLYKEEGRVETSIMLVALLCLKKISFNICSTACYWPIFTPV